MLLTAVLSKKFTVLSACVKTEERSQIYNLTFHLKKMEKRVKSTPKAISRKEIINTRVEIHKTVNREILEKIKETKSRFFEKIQKSKNL